VHCTQTTTVLTEGFGQKYSLNLGLDEQNLEWFCAAAERSTTNLMLECHKNAPMNGLSNLQNAY
jgi:hypothetical protein